MFVVDDCQSVVFKSSGAGVLMPMNSRELVTVSGALSQVLKSAKVFRPRLVQTRSLMFQLSCMCRGVDWFVLICLNSQEI